MRAFEAPATQEGDTGGVGFSALSRSRQESAALCCIIGRPALAMVSNEPVDLFILVFVHGAPSFALGSTLTTRVLYEAAGAPTMAGSYATATLNMGAAVGPVIAAATLNTEAGDPGPL